MPDVPVYLGACPEGVIETASELVVSPGVAMNDPIVVSALEADVKVVGDVDLFMAQAQAPVVGITGSNAKSTVTSLLGCMAVDAGLNVGVGGNLGTPALELLDADKELYVLELSSFQLERSSNLGLTVAAVLNVSPDHLDRHGSMTEYHRAKHRIFQSCRAAVVNPQDPLPLPLVPEDVEVVSWRMGEPELGGFGLRLIEGEEFLCRGFEALMPVADLAMPGRHNVANALAALALGNCIGLSVRDMVQTLGRFRGLPHRCELVGSVRGLRFINDSKGTNIGATAAALEGLSAGRDIVLIAGGQGKGADFSLLRGPVNRCCKAVVLIGEDAAAIHSALDESVQVIRATSMEDAVTSAATFADPGDTVLLSPACASFDMFSGYEERGEAFCAAVGRLSGAGL
jgi:UDP-N-acetylmuramoylalanine--D-glutamate ligase